MTNDQNNARAYSESDSLARDIKEGTLSGFVGNGTALTGEANFKGMLRVDGHLTGRVSSEDGTLIVSSGGQVDANVEVSVAQIYGTVNGDVIATKRIEMGRVAKVTGNIQTPALVIEQGAMFEGSCRMMQAQQRDATGEARPAAGAVPGTAAAAPMAQPAPVPGAPPRPFAPPSPSPAPAGMASPPPGVPVVSGVPKPADGMSRPSPATN